VVLFATLLSAPTIAVGQETPAAAPAWDKETIRLFRSLPIQDEGRIKPLDTYAGFKLLKFNGRRTCKTPDGRTQTAVAWLLDCLFYPEVAQDYLVFSVNTSDVIVALGIPPHEKKRDRYCYRELQPRRDKLFELADLYSRIDARNRSIVQSQIINLAHNVMEYEAIAEYAQFARRPFTLEPCEALSRIFPNTSEARLADILNNAPVLHNEFLAVKKDRRPPNETHAKDLKAFNKLFGDLDAIRNTARALAVFPPANPDQKQWLTPADIILKAFEPGAQVSREIAMLSEFEALAHARNDPDQFQRHAASFAGQVVDLAMGRGEYAKIGIEAAFYQWGFFSRGLVFYVLGFLLVALSWLIPRSRWIYGVSLGFLLVPTSLLVAGITLRCIIRSRPPVTTLYETILFTTAVIVVISLAVEYLNRQRIAVSLAAILGVAGMFLANKYEAREGVDTMPSMVAVLDTNFWLATHVTTISMGYAAGLLSGAVAHVYILGRIFGLRKSDAAFYAGLTRTVYGVFCFGFFFAFIGTLLGGIWANESWGRFWGWDPKENGALLIVLWQLATLHARTGGYIRDLGLNVAAVVCGMVVAFSWWGVNLLGIGLHSYGFTQGAMTGLLLFWVLETAVVFLGLLIWAGQRRRGDRSGACRAQ
jgi:ABC-type transport system involved in cytochrome c biogenesis permease subunit